MTVVHEIGYEPVIDPDDPDDYRPGSRLAFVFDVGDASGRAVRSLHFIYEIAPPGDGAPLHVHPVDEAILVEAGEMEVRIGDSVDRVRPEAVVFIPRGLPHAWRSVGEGDLKIRAVFPTDFVAIHYLERNPAPGTEGDAPRPAWWLDLREGVL
jgi:mannose-6-phosphate isomerase-like protein (cupin superfamily)